MVIDDDTIAAAADWPFSPEVAARDDSDTAVILYTSGTTGTPKGAQLTHANLYRNAVAFTALFDLCQNDVVLGCLPLFHAFGQSNGLNASIAVGACVSLVPRFEPTAVLQLIERHRVTVFEGVPTMYVTLLHTDADGVDASSLRMCVSGGAALPVEVLNGFQNTFGAPILEGYGLSETSPTAAYNRPGRTKAGSIGLPLDGVELKLVNPDGTETPPGEAGEIVIRGHNVMKGYWNRPEATEAAIVDGWFHTGDMATRDDDGFYFIVDRKKDLIIRGGYNVYPREIEEVLYEHPAVREAAVIGVPHATHGEEVAAAVVLRPGTSATPAELRDYVKTRVAAYKYPRLVWFVDALPKGPTGKILKREIQAPTELLHRTPASAIHRTRNLGAHMADRTERATVGRIELAYETFGDTDAPPLLLIAGLATQMLGWDERFCMQLADNGFRVIRFDNRDIGQVHSPRRCRCSEHDGLASRQDEVEPRRTRWWTWPTTPLGCSTRSGSSPRTLSACRWAA